MNFVWDQQDTVDMSDFTYYFNILKIRVRDQYMQQFFGTISNNARLQKYSVYKTVFSFEEYLNVLTPKHRIVMSKFRYSSHKLMIEQGRHLNIDRENRICQIVT